MTWLQKIFQRPMQERPPYVYVGWDYYRRVKALALKVPELEAKAQTLEARLAVAEEQAQQKAHEVEMVQNTVALLRQALARITARYEDEVSLNGPIRTHRTEELPRHDWLRWTDEVLLIPTRSAWERFFDNLPDYGAWVKDVNDCDDYAREIIARAKRFFPQAPIGWVDCWFPSAIRPGKTESHRMNTLLWHDGQEIVQGYYSYVPPAGQYLHFSYGVPGGIFEMLPQSWEPKWGEI